MNMTPMPIISKTFVLFLVLSRTVYADIDPTVEANCPVALGPPATNQEWHDLFMFGGDVLSVQLLVEGWRHGMGPELNYRNKLWWFSKGYKGLTDPVSFLTVTGRRLDAEDDPAYVKSVSEVVESVESAMDGTGNSSMLALIEFPNAGCWEITGEYGGQVLVFVVLVGEHEHIEASDTQAASASELNR
jgi:hypothetical protein